MTITTRDQLINALANNSSRLVIDKASLANAVAGQLFSMWRATGQPGQGAIPTTAVVPTNALAGALQFDQQTAPVTSYLAWLAVAGGNNAMGWEIHDRIAHQAGLVLNVTTAQSTNLPIDLQTLAPPAARLGAANYSDVQWFLDVYADGGATAANLTVPVTYDDGSTGNLNAIAVGGTLRAGRRIPLTPFIPTASQGRYIRAINSGVILSASTGTAGNFGFTCTRQRSAFTTLVANKTENYDWSLLGSPEIPNGSCLELVAVCSTTSTGTLRGQGKIAHG